MIIRILKSYLKNVGKGPYKNSLKGSLLNISMPYQQLIAILIQY